MVPRFKPAIGWREIIALFRLNSGAVEKFEKEFAEKFQSVDAVASWSITQWAFLKL